MENLSFEKKERMDLTVETLGIAIQEWIKNDDSDKVRESVDKLARISGVSARTIDSIKNYNGGPNKPDPHLSTMQKISAAIHSKLEINKKFDSE